MPLDGARVDCGSQRAQVVMIADALEFHHPAVEEKPLLAIELDGANAERRLISIQHLRARFHRGHGTIQHGCFDVPTARPVHSQQCDRMPHRSCPDDFFVRLAGDGPAAVVHKLGGNRDGHTAAPAVADTGPHRHRGARVRHCRRGDVRSPLFDMNGLRGDQPDVAIDACPGIPARRILFGREFHGDYILLAVAEMRRQVERETGVSIRAPAGFDAVDPHRGVTHRAVDLDRDEPPFGIGRHWQVLAIPAGA